MARRLLRRHVDGQYTPEGASGDRPVSRSARYLTGTRLRSKTMYYTRLRAALLGLVVAGAVGGSSFLFGPAARKPIAAQEGARVVAPSLGGAPCACHCMISRKRLW